MSDPKANHFYRAFGVLFGVAGIGCALIGPGPSVEVRYAPATGIAAFAVLFVIAQAVERLVEWVTDLLELIPNSTAKKKAVATRELRAAVSTLDATESKTKEAEVDEARTDIRFLAHGLAILLAAIAVSWLDYGILESLGVTGFSPDLDGLNRLLTALAAAGGSTALHELISRVQVAKEKAQTSA